MVGNEDETSRQRMIRTVKYVRRRMRFKAEDIRIRTYYRRKALRWKLEDAVDKVCNFVHATFDRPRSPESRYQESRTPQQAPRSPEILQQDLRNEPFPWWHYTIQGYQDVPRFEAVRGDGRAVSQATTRQPDATSEPRVDMTTWFVGGDARIQAYPHVYDDVSRTILQHAEGQLCSTTIQLDEGPGQRPIALCVGNDVRVADFVNSTVSDMVPSQPHVTQANLRSMAEIMDDRFTPMSPETRAEFGSQRQTTLTMWRTLGDGVSLQ